MKYDVLEMFDENDVTLFIYILSVKSQGTLGSLQRFMMHSLLPHVFPLLGN